MKNINGSIISIVREGSEGNAKECSRNCRGISMNEFPYVLKDAIMNWGAVMKEATGKAWFHPYDELSHLTNIAPQTLRKYCLEYSGDPKFPPVHSLVAICKAISDWSAFDFLASYVKTLKEM